MDEKLLSGFILEIADALREDAEELKNVDTGGHTQASIALTKVAIRWEELSDNIRDAK